MDIYNNFLFNEKVDKPVYVLTAINAIYILKMFYVDRDISQISYGELIINFLGIVLVVAIGIFLLKVRYRPEYKDMGIEVPFAVISLFLTYLTNLVILGVDPKNIFWGIRNRK